MIKLFTIMSTSQIDDILTRPLDEVITIANRVRQENIGRQIELCGIVNAKSGRCGEDCRFCAQSAHHNTDILEYPLKTKNEIVAAAKESKENGAERFGIVTSGNRLMPDEVKVVAEAVKEIAEKVGISPCASLGALSEGSFKILKDAGLTRYHHNIETSERFYPNIVSTHSYEERINTVRLAKKAGFEICSGGIIGLGEDWQDRASMALLLKELDVDSVPLNFLVPVKGTPLENFKSISPVDAIRTIALFRIILKDKTIKVAAGRESVLKDYQDLIYMAGANGMLIGGYLTVAGRSVDEDLALVREVNEIWNRK
ncbi:MAG: biotin synthase BioB [Candidatus Omnitrophota bacterium]